MGFFQDLKEDLSMAVNELLPEVDKELETPEKMAENDSNIMPEKIKSEAIRPKAVISKEESKAEADDKERALRDEETFFAAVARLDENADIFATKLQVEESFVPDVKAEGQSAEEPEIQEKKAEEEAVKFDLFAEIEPEVISPEPATNIPEPAEMDVEPEAKEEPEPAEMNEEPETKEEPEPKAEESAMEMDLSAAIEPEVISPETATNIPEPAEMNEEPEAKEEPEPAEMNEEPEAKEEPAPVEMNEESEVKEEPAPAEMNAEPATKEEPEPRAEESAMESNLSEESEWKEMIPEIDTIVRNEVEEEIKEGDKKEMQDDLMQQVFGEVLETDEQEELEKEVGNVMTQQNEVGSIGEVLDETGLTGEVLDETAIITAGMKITGDISSQGSMDILGVVNGNVEILGKLSISGSVEGNSIAEEIFADSAKITGEVRARGSVKVGQSSVIIGNIHATSAVIAGAVKGDIDVQGPVILDTSAIVMGNIKSKSVQINNGAVIEGMCSQCYADVNPTSFFKDLEK